ncbi:MAG TPA: DNA-binding protein [Phycisphaerales bacterium]|nr:DNA-binding protein [Phycisphaerales bacterium]
MSDPTPGVSSSPAVLLTVGDVAERLSCSTRTVYRLSDSGQMPRPIRLGALVRWDGAVIDRWIAEGCPRVAKAPGGGS